MNERKVAGCVCFPASFSLFESIEDLLRGREERLVQRFTMRYLFRFEAEHLLERSGFEVESVYADFQKSPYGSKFPGDLVFVARKR